MKINQQILTAKIELVGAGTPAYYFADSPFHDGTNYYEPLIVQAPEHNGRIGSEVWGTTTQSSISSLVVDALKYPDLHEDPRVRTATITLKIFWKNSLGYVDSKDVFVGTIDSIDKNDDEHDIKISNYMAELDKPAQSNVYPDTMTDGAMNNQPEPFIIGSARTCPLVTVNGIEDVFTGNDGEFGYYSTIADNLSPFSTTPGVDYDLIWDTESESFAVDLVSPDWGIITSDLVGPSVTGPFEVLDTDFLSGDGEFTTWTGSGFTAEPNGFTTTVASGAYLYQQPTGEARFYTLSQTKEGDTYLTYTADSLTLGSRYKLSVEVDPGSTSGNRHLEVWTDDIKVADIAWGASTLEQTIELDFVAKGTELTIRAPSISTYKLDVSIDHLIIQKYISGTARPDTYLWHLLTVKGGIDPAKIDDASFTDFVAIKDYRIGSYHDKAENIKTIAQTCVDSMFGFLIDSPDGKISLGLIQDPDGMTSVFDIDRTNIDGEIKVSVDWAPGLSDSVSAKRNYYVFDLENIADSVSNSSKSLYIKQYRRTEKSTVDVHDFYAHARSAPPSEGILDKTAEAQPEAEGRCTIYSQIRYFKEIPVSINDLSVYDLKYGDCVTYDGEKHLLVGKRFRYGDHQMILTIWN